MYSFESCGVVLGNGGANGFHELDAFAGSSLPNQPVFLPVFGSVLGSQPFEAKMPRAMRNTRANELRL